MSLLGRNGVGRSTTVKAIMGEVPPVGEHPLQGRDDRRPASRTRSRACGLGYVPEDRDIFPEPDRAREPDARHEATRGASGAGRIDDMFALFPRLRERARHAGGVLSGGEQQMLTICRTLMGDPDLIMIDEPTEGLAPKMVEQVAGCSSEIAGRGVSILLVEQKLTIALEISQRLYVMGHGRIVFEGTPADPEANHGAQGMARGLRRA